MEYVDGFMSAVPTANKDAYREHASRVSELFIQYGAPSFVECWGDDIPPGEKTSMPMAVQCGEDETVVFSWITWPSKAVRDEGMQKVMEDDLGKAEFDAMPFDATRLIYGGFTVLVNR